MLIQFRVRNKVSDEHIAEPNIWRQVMRPSDPPRALNDREPDLILQCFLNGSKLQPTCPHH
jgi:hypothetical protein